MHLDSSITNRGPILHPLHLPWIALTTTLALVTCLPNLSVESRERFKTLQKISQCEHELILTSTWQALSAKNTQVGYIQPLQLQLQILLASNKNLHRSMLIVERKMI